MIKGEAKFTKRGVADDHDQKVMGLLRRAPRNKESAAQLRELMEILNPREREIIEARAFGGLTLDDVADHMNYSKSAVNYISMIARAKMSAIVALRAMGRSGAARGLCAGESKPQARADLSGEGY